MAMDLDGEIEDGFLNGQGPAPLEMSSRSWKVLVVDPQSDFHRGVEQGLFGFTFNGKPLQFLFAQSGAEARILLRDHADIAVAFIEAVLETQDAGLSLVNFIRKQMGNNRTRILLCTAHPTLAPERLVVENYEVNDYRLKTDLSADRLRIIMLEALRALDNILVVEANRRGMAQLMAASSGLFEFKSPRFFYTNLLIQLNAILEMNADALFCLVEDRSLETGRVTAGIGRFKPFGNVPLSGIGCPKATAALDKVLTTNDALHTVQCVAIPFPVRNDVMGLAYVEGRRELSALDWQILELFRRKASMALKISLLLEEVSASQKATVHALAKLAEYKDNAASGHLNRIERLVTEMARELQQKGLYRDQIDEEMVEKIGLASILHDVGMVSVPDDILMTPGELVEEDLKVIYRHTDIGHHILQEAGASVRGRNILLIAADIAQAHHERFDGSGYPAGLRGQEIPLAARLVTVADVFDALVSERYYKQAWPVEKAIHWINEQAGSDFDPVVVEAFTAAIQRILAETPDWLPAKQLQAPPEKRSRGLFGRLWGRQG